MSEAVISVDRKFQGQTLEEIDVVVDLDIERIGGPDRDDGPEYSVNESYVLRNEIAYAPDGSEIGVAFKAGEKIELTDDEKQAAFELVFNRMAK